ncbi:MAG: nucleoside triphosphate pyrophosphohydrolase, partial [Coriobacteriia bacterium]|nr:nucleoside triphosphate pyrophosphohydrolase [Coriobacteriia bacterium]
HDVVIATTLSHGGFALSLTTVEDLARADLEDDTAAYIGPWRLTSPRGFPELVRVIAMLRAPDGCPWDRAQDHLTLRRHMIEEAHEAVAAIESDDPEAIADELGDVLLQVVLHAQIAAEAGTFTVDDVVARITEKIRRRHPHVFGDVHAETPEAVSENWDAIKRDEKAGGLLADVPMSLPALMLAQKISRRAVGVGFEWETIDDIWAKVHEEIDEIKATEPGSPEAAGEIGDLLFTVVNLARKQGIDAEEALRTTCRKFAGRWFDMESSASQQGLQLESMGIEGLERLWTEAKRNEVSGQ